MFVDGGSGLGVGGGLLFVPRFDFEPFFPGGEVEEAGVGSGLPGEERSYGDEDEGGYPHAYGSHGAFAD